MSKYPYPFYNYPYTFSQKLDYYTKNAICATFWLTGVGIHADYLTNQPIITNKELTNKTTAELTDLSRISVSKSYWHGWMMVGTSVILGPAVYFGLYKNESVPRKYLSNALAGTGLLLLNSIYGMMGGFYNSLRIENQLKSNQHDIDVERTAKAVASEIETIQQSTSQNSTESKSSIKNKLDARKMIWINSKFEWPDSTSYVIHNGYYENLFFVFSISQTAEKFCTELAKINISQIDYLANHPEEAIRIQNVFIKECLCERLMKNRMSDL